MEKRLYDGLTEVLFSVTEVDGGLEGEQLTGFASMRGCHSRNGLMVVGRSVNGWLDGWNAVELRDEQKRQNVIQDIVARCEPPDSDGRCPMAWVTDQWGDERQYNTARSAFWRCIERVSRGIGIVQGGAPDWSSYLVWTNLYKVSPCEGGNPPPRLMEAQHTACRKLLHSEIEASDVQAILFLTGLDWAYSFLPEMTDIRFAGAFTNYVALSGWVHSLGGTPVPLVVASHPQGKREDAWTGEVREAFRRLRREHRDLTEELYGTEQQQTAG